MKLFLDFVLYQVFMEKIENTFKHEQSLMLHVKKIQCKVQSDSARKEILLRVALKINTIMHGI